MAKSRIKRRVMIGDKQVWVTAETEQEYAENLLKAMNGGGIVAKPEETKHNCAEYAWNWYYTFSLPNIDRSTAKTYDRQLRLHILPVIGEMNIEDLTPA